MTSDGNLDENNCFILWERISNNRDKIVCGKPCNEKLHFHQYLEKFKKIDFFVLWTNMGCMLWTEKLTRTPDIVSL